MRNLKKVISSVAALAIVASSASAFAVTFPDVDASASYLNAVNTLTGLKIVEGDDNGLFNPDKSVTRAEFTKMAVGALGEIAAAEAQTTSQFDDAANTSVHWAAGFVAQGVADGFINGYDDHRFGPDDTVTYAQACKMLVAAIGYTSYAEAAGGWPSGYVSQASSLGISKGVNAQNDVALTRAQCAVLIYNAMDVPLNVIDGWKTETTLTGTVQVPEFSKLDGFDKKAGDYQTLYTDKHDAYYVKGRVMKTSREGGLEKDEVQYDVEVADNFDDAKYGGNYGIADGKTFKVGDTNAADLLFAYTEAVVQKNEDTDEFTIISIVNYGDAKTVEFAADDVSDEDKTIGEDYIGNNKLPVFKSDTTSSTTKYDLADGSATGTEPVKIYVNGVLDDTEGTKYATNSKIKKYTGDRNKTGRVTLVDKTKVGSTSTDGDYDYIMVTYYVDAIVDYTQTTSSVARVYFKDQQSKDSKLEWDPDDKDLDLKFTKDGNEIAYTDLNEYDVLSIQYNIVKYPLDNSDSLKSTGSNDQFFNVLVATQSVTGDLTNKDVENQAITIAGNKYDLVTDITGELTGLEGNKDIAELGTEYTAYIDAFGYVAYLDEGTSDKNYGVIVRMYKSTSNEYPTVRMITSDAKVVDYECKNNEEALKFYNYAMFQDENYNNDVFAEFSKSDMIDGPIDPETGKPTKVDSKIRDNIKKGKTVCTYKLSGGKAKFDKAYSNDAGGEGLTFKASTNKLDGYTLNETVTKIIDMDDYMSSRNSGSTVKTLTIASFEDDANYDAYLYDRNKNGDYRFAIVFKGTSSLRPETQIAVIKYYDGQKDVDSTTCNAYTVLKGGQEVEVLDEDRDHTYGEGTVIAYVVGSEGYVEDDNLQVLFDPATDDYDVLLSNVTLTADFGEMLQNVKPVTVKTKARKAIDFGEGPSTNKDILAYLGVVYRKSGNTFELFTSKTGETSYVNDTVDFSLANANVYTFDFNERSGKGVRLGVGNSGTQNTSIFNQVYSEESGAITTDSKAAKNYVTWDIATLGSFNVTPQIAFVREVDNEVTDVVFYVAP